MPLLWGCSTPRSVVSDTSSVTVVPPEAAFASLGPGAPPVISIVQTTYANATRQAIALATDGAAPGQNELRVDVLGISNSIAGVEDRLADRPLNEEQLAGEAQTALPGVPMRRSLTYVQNQYGPFGYALGRAARGELCIYAWQRIATPDLDVSLFNRRATVSIRLRLCRPNATETNLVAAMMGLNVNASLSSGSWSQAPRPLSPDIGAAGAPIGPSPLSAAPPPAAPAAAVPRRKRAPVRAGVFASPPPVMAPAATGVAIPPPPAVQAGAGSAAVPPPPVIPAPPQGTQP
ncbi:cellulose biosynthesis protein BcsN [Labrys okinawensis]|uniref:cellulose biosynthesis protein BcsN n=1 Tax=Labrys okinawensis TaxID=346911 RepID=UPI0015E43CF7|nr:cellulose biosynthesis protein BcsN [Labrys okinawensis]